MARRNRFSSGFSHASYVIALIGLLVGAGLQSVPGQQATEKKVGGPKTAAKAETKKADSKNKGKP